MKKMSQKLWPLCFGGCTSWHGIKIIPPADFEISTVSNIGLAGITVHFSLSTSFHIASATSTLTHSLTNCRVSNVQYPAAVRLINAPVYTSRCLLPPHYYRYGGKSTCGERSWLLVLSILDWLRLLSIFISTLHYNIVQCSAVQYSTSRQDKNQQNVADGERDVVCCIYHILRCAPKHFQSIFFVVFMAIRLNVAAAAAVAGRVVPTVRMLYYCFMIIVFVGNI